MANIIPAQSAELEDAGTGNWAAWYGCTVAKTTEDANLGTGSLKISCSGGAWGVNLNNWPGWSSGVVASHDYGLEWNVKGGPLTGSTATLTFMWRNDGGTVLLEEPMAISTSQLEWRSAAKLSTSPATTTRLYCEITGDNTAGTTFYVDTVVADDAPSGGGGAQVVTPTSIASAEAFGNPAVSASLTIQPAGIATGEVFGAATLSPGEVAVSPGAIASVEAFGTPVVSSGGATIAPDSITSGEQWGTPTLVLTLHPAGIGSSETFGAPTLTVGGASITPEGIVSGEVFGTVEVTGGQIAVTPLERTHTVPAETRTHIVPASIRTTTVATESRATSVPAGERTLSVD
ncbi:hypothetical protein [Amycolatopsis palatopharyngis]|uniref:hypothetical protein n=1 Tax=Amycolatopsis palatopharyngis TaxID=187982 RepID=UPI000E2636DA|nr:hypothetical protein [Amycolatopsis palatopharyngis]